MPKDNANPETGNDEVLTASVPAVREKGPTGLAIGNTTFKVKDLVTVPILKHNSGETIGVRIDQPIRRELTSREVEVATASGELVKGTQEGQIAVVRVTELGSMQAFNLVLNAITASELERRYNTENANGVPDYVGRFFAIKKLGVVAGKRYKEVQIAEIEPTGTEAAE